MYFFGEQKDNSSINLQEARELLKKASETQIEFATYPRSKVLELLDHLGKLWASPEFPMRKEVTKELPSITGFSQEMIDLAMEHVCQMLSRKNLEEKLNTELRNIPVRSEISETTDSRTLTWQPLGVTLHVVSGNVFLAGLGSLVEGLITGNVTLIKMSSAETYFLPRFLETLNSCDVDGVVSKNIAAFTYSSGQKDVIQCFQNHVDGLVVWGGEQAVQAYRQNLPAKTKLIVFGPKLSLGFVDSRTLTSAEAIKNIASNIAQDISVWDQQACTAPQTLFIGNANNDQPDLKTLKLLGETLAEELSELCRSLPPGEIDPQTAVEIQKWRSVAEIEDSLGTGFYFASKGNCNYTVAGTTELRLEASPLHRTIKIIFGNRFEDILEEIKPFKGQLQSLGLHCRTEDRFELENRFFDIGFVRIMPLGQMAGGSIDDPHDGKYDLPELMNLGFSHRTQTQALSQRAADLPNGAHIEEKLLKLIAQAKNSAYYSRLLENCPINNLDDLKKFPILTRDILEREMAPYGTGLQTKDWQGGYVTRSGGSTGEPKFSIYDKEDWDRMINHACSVLEKCGLQRGDRMANFMLAGDLYGGFVSFDHINSKLGVTTFAFAGSDDVDLFVKTVGQFNINVVQGVPTSLLPFLRKAKSINPNLTVEKVIYAGSPMASADKQWLRQRLGTQRISSVIGANDGGQIAYQCQYLKGNEHHLVEDYNYIELVDEHGQPVAAGEEGRILITSLDKFAFPLIRYDIGDSGRFIEKNCTCGEKVRTIQYLGRSDETLAVGMLNFNCRDLERVLEPHKINQFQIIASSKQGKERLRLKLERSQWTDDNKKLLQKDVFSKLGKLQERLTEGHLAGFDFDFLEIGQIPRSDRTGKSKRIIDERLGSI